MAIIVFAKNAVIKRTKNNNLRQVDIKINKGGNLWRQQRIKMI